MLTTIERATERTSERETERRLNEWSQKKYNVHKWSDIVSFFFWVKKSNRVDSVTKIETSKQIGVGNFLKKTQINEMKWKSEMNRKGRDEQQAEKEEMRQK